MREQTDGRNTLNRKHFHAAFVLSLGVALAACSATALADETGAMTDSETGTSISNGADSNNTTGEQNSEQKTTSNPKKLSITAQIGYRISTKGMWRTNAKWKKTSLGKSASTKSSSKALTGMSVKIKKSTYKGSISYSINTTEGSWSKFYKNGKKAKKGSAAIEAIRIKLSGDLAKKANVFYRVKLAHSGWMGWTKNGKKAGVSGLDKQIMAYQVKIVPKTEKLPVSDQDAYMTNKSKTAKTIITGDEKIDEQLVKRAKKLKTLRACYNWVKNHSHTNWAGMGITRYKSGTSYWWADECDRMLNGRATDCYAYATTFAGLARALGYDATTVCGYVPSRSLGWAAHSWARVTLKSGKRYYDPDLGRSYGSGFYQFTYGGAPTSYRQQR